MPAISIASHHQQHHSREPGTDRRREAGRSPRPPPSGGRHAGAVGAGGAAGSSVSAGARGMVAASPLQKTRHVQLTPGTAAATDSSVAGANRSVDAHASWISSQQSAASFMPSSAQSVSSAASAISSIAPWSSSGRARRDVSFIDDVPGHGHSPRANSSGLDVAIPPTTIPKDMWLIQKSALPPQAGARGGPTKEASLQSETQSWFDDNERVWNTVVFPALRPTSRRDVQLLDDWLTMQLSTSSTSTPAGSGDAGPQGPAGAGSSTARPEVRGAGDAQVARERIRILSMGFNELVRQVTLHCAERGELLHRVWCSLQELYQTVISEMEATLSACEEHMESQQEAVDQAMSSMANVRMSHKEELDGITESMKLQFSRKVRQLRDEVARKTQELETVQQRDQQLRVWFPRFDLFAGSILSHLLPDNASDVVRNGTSRGDRDSGEEGEDGNGTGTDSKAARNRIASSIDSDTDEEEQMLLPENAFKADMRRLSQYGVAHFRAKFASEGADDSDDDMDDDAALRILLEYEQEESEAASRRASPRGSSSRALDASSPSPSPAAQHAAHSRDTPSPVVGHPVAPAAAPSAATAAATGPAAPVSNAASAAGDVAATEAIGATGSDATMPPSDRKAAESPAPSTAARPPSGSGTASRNRSASAPDGVETRPPTAGSETRDGQGPPYAGRRLRRMASADMMMLATKKLKRRLMSLKQQLRTQTQISNELQQSNQRTEEELARVRQELEEQRNENRVAHRMFKDDTRRLRRDINSVVHVVESTLTRAAPPRAVHLETSLADLLLIDTQTYLRQPAGPADDGAAAASFVPRSLIPARGIMSLPGLQRELVRLVKMHITLVLSTAPRCVSTIKDFPGMPGLMDSLPARFRTFVYTEYLARYGSRRAAENHMRNLVLSLLIWCAPANGAHAEVKALAPRKMNYHETTQLLQYQQLLGLYGSGGQMQQQQQQQQEQQQQRPSPSQSLLVANRTSFGDSFRDFRSALDSTWQHEAGGGGTAGDPSTMLEAADSQEAGSSSNPCASLDDSVLFAVTLESADNDTNPEKGGESSDSELDRPGTTDHKRVQGFKRTGSLEDNPATQTDNIATTTGARYGTSSFLSAECNFPRALEQVWFQAFGAIQTHVAVSPVVPSYNGGIAPGECPPLPTSLIPILEAVRVVRRAYGLPNEVLADVAKLETPLSGAGEDIHPGVSTNAAGKSGGVSPSSRATTHVNVAHLPHPRSIRAWWEWLPPDQALRMVRGLRTMSAMHTCKYVEAFDFLRLCVEESLIFARRFHAAVHTLGEMILGLPQPARAMLFTPTRSFGAGSGSSGTGGAGAASRPSYAREAYVSGRGVVAAGSLSIAEMGVILHIVEGRALPLHVVRGLFAEAMEQSGSDVLDPEAVARVCTTYPVTGVGLYPLFSGSASVDELYDDAAGSAANAVDVMLRELISHRELRPKHVDDHLLSILKRAVLAEKNAVDAEKGSFGPTKKHGPTMVQVHVEGGDSLFTPNSDEATARRFFTLRLLQAHLGAMRAERQLCVAGDGGQRVKHRLEEDGVNDEDDDFVHSNAREAWITAPAAHAYSIRRRLLWVWQTWRAFMASGHKQFRTQRDRRDLDSSIDRMLTKQRSTSFHLRTLGSGGGSGSGSGRGSGGAGGAGGGGISAAAPRQPQPPSSEQNAGPNSQVVQEAAAGLAAARAALLSSTDVEEK